MRATRESSHARPRYTGMASTKTMNRPRQALPRLVGVQLIISHHLIHATKSTPPIKHSATSSRKARQASHWRVVGSSASLLISLPPPRCGYTATLLHQRIRNRESWSCALHSRAIVVQWGDLTDEATPAYMQTLVSIVAR